MLVAEHFILNPLSRLVMESRGSVPEPFHESLVERVMTTDSDPTIILPLFPLMAMEQIQRVLVRLLARPESEVIIRLVLNYLFGETSDAILSRRKRAKQEEQTNSGVKPSVFFSALITLPEFAATSSLTSPQARTDSNLSSPPPSHGMEVDEQIRSVTCESVTQLDPNFLRNITSAISFCLSRTDLFPIAVLKNSFLSLIELSSLPCLFMRTVCLFFGFRYSLSLRTCFSLKRPNDSFYSVFMYPFLQEFLMKPSFVTILLAYLIFSE